MELSRARPLARPLRRRELLTFLLRRGELVLEPGNFVAQPLDVRRQLFGRRVGRCAVAVVEVARRRRRRHGLVQFDLQVPAQAPHRGNTRGCCVNGCVTFHPVSGPSLPSFATSSSVNPGRQTLELGRGVALRSCGDRKTKGHLFSVSSLSIRFQSLLTRASCSCSSVFSSSTFSRRSCSRVFCLACVSASSFSIFRISLLTRHSCSCSSVCSSCTFSCLSCSSRPGEWKRVSESARPQTDSRQRGGGRKLT